MLEPETFSFLISPDRRTIKQILQAEPRILGWPIAENNNAPSATCQRGVTHIANYEIGSRSMPT
jgi:hypothetical protein